MIINADHIDLNYNPIEPAQLIVSGESLSSEF
jgi:hypothetical protein